MSCLIGYKAPDFVAAAILPTGEVQNQLKLSEVINRKYGFLFFYPLDFTFVCPSELIALNHRIEAFNARDVEVLSISIDSHFTHLAWRNTPIEKGGIGPVGFTMVGDLNHRITQSYGIQHPELGVAYRACVLIDKEGIIRSQTINDLPLGRNIDEQIRLIDAMQHYETHGEVCPAGWKPGQAAIQASPTGIAEYLSANHQSL